MVRLVLMLLSLMNSSWSFAQDIIPYNQKNWTKFNQLPSMKISSPVLMNKHLNVIGVINEEIRPKTKGVSAASVCKEFKGETKKQYCKIQAHDMTTFLFSKEFKKGIYFQSVSFNNKYLSGITDFESGVKQ